MMSTQMSPSVQSLIHSYKGALAVIAGACSTKFFTELVKDESWQHTTAVLTGLAVGRAVYNYLSSLENSNKEEEEVVVVSSRHSLQKEEEKPLLAVQKEAENDVAAKKKVSDDSRCQETDEEEKKEEHHNKEECAGEILDDSRFQETEGEEKKEEHNEDCAGADKPTAAILPNTDNNDKNNKLGAQSLAGDCVRRGQNDDEQRSVAGGGGAASVATAPAGYYLSPESLAGESPITRAQLLAKQENIESDKILFLRKEVAKLKSKNARIQNDLEYLKDSNQRMKEANQTAGESFKTLNEHIKHLSKTNEKVTSELSGCRQQVQRLNLTQMELKEELKLKQATYAAEVQSRLQYQRLVASIVDTVQERCRDTKLVEDILRSTDAWEEQSQHTLNSVSP